MYTAKHGHGVRDSQSHELPAKGLASSTWRLNLHDEPAGADDRWSRPPLRRAPSKSLTTSNRLTAHN